MDLVRGNANSPLPSVRLVEGGATTYSNSTSGQRTIEIGYENGDLDRPIDGARLIRSIVRSAMKFRLKGIHIPLEALNPLAGKYGKYDLARQLGEQLTLANYEFNVYKSEAPKDKTPLESIVVSGANDTEWRDVELGRKIADEINWARDLANTPANDMSPSQLGAAITNHLQQTSDAHVSHLSDAETKDMGLFRGVARGAKEGGAFIVASYTGTDETLPPLVFIGKGVTYDTGGHDLKTQGSMYGMHLDMSGGAAAATAVAVATILRPQRSVIAIVLAVENAISPEAIHPGDILRSYSGKTVEVINTDAEGRLILADGLAYVAKKYPTATAITVATLTGSAIRTLGKQASALFTKSDDIAKRLVELGETSGNRLWRLPLYPEYLARIKSVRADLSNIDKDDAKDAGASLGATFLAQFAGGLEWAHIDMAPREVSVPEDQLAEGAAGEPISLFTKIMQVDLPHQRHSV